MTRSGLVKKLLEDYLEGRAGEAPADMSEAIGKAAVLEEENSLLLEENVALTERSDALAVFEKICKDPTEYTLMTINLGHGDLLKPELLPAPAGEEEGQDQPPGGEGGEEPAKPIVESMQRIIDENTPSPHKEEESGGGGGGGAAVVALLAYLVARHKGWI